MSDTDNKADNLSDNNPTEPAKARKLSPRQKTFIRIGLGLAAFLMILALLATLEMGRPTASRVVCGTNVSGIAKALTAYASDEEPVRFPDPNRWCDLLIERDYTSARQFHCPQAKGKGPGHYAINPNATPTSDPDTVLVFETDAGWNQSGGPEILSTKNHEGIGCNIGFVDMHVRFVKKEQFSKLKWKSDLSKDKIMAQLKVDDKAPAFSLPDQNGDTVSLSDFKGKKVLVYFYPKADTPGCTKQSCSVRDASEELAKLGVVPLGISPDVAQAQKKFDDKFNLGFTLLCDPDHKTVRAYGAWGQKSNYGKTYEGIIRSSFLIDEQGTIIGTWYKVKPLDTVPNAIEALTAE